MRSVASHVREVQQLSIKNLAPKQIKGQGCISESESRRERSQAPWPFRAPSWPFVSSWLWPIKVSLQTILVFSLTKSRHVGLGKCPNIEGIIPVTKESNFKTGCFKVTEVGSQVWSRTNQSTYAVFKYVSIDSAQEEVDQQCKDLGGRLVSIQADKARTLESVIKAASGEALALVDGGQDGVMGHNFALVKTL